MKECVVKMNNIEKRFGEVVAVASGSMEIKKGEIHALIGENGAGKSTMMKLLYGLYPLDNGDLEVFGENITYMTPKKAISLGIGMVHQEFMLIDELTVLENIILGFEPKKGVVIDFSRGRESIQHFVDQYGLSLQLDRRINQISIGEAQRVEIIKCLSRGAEILILDEPTAVLTPQETAGLFKILEKLKNDGKSVVFISHKLDEVMSISDRITVMRQGKYVDTFEKSSTNTRELAEVMIGREVFLDIKKEKSLIGDTVLEVKDLWVSGKKEISKIRGLNFSLSAGEILGVAGIDGNGQSELVEAIVGLRKVEKGTICFEGTNITHLPVEARRSLGIAHIPEDRNTRGLNRSFNIAENLISTQLGSPRFSKYGIFQQEKIQSYASAIVANYDIRPSNVNISTQNLSGGNAQKIVVSREVLEEGTLLVAAQPTRGVDIGAIESIRSILEKEKAKGRAVLLVSADLEEILSLSDRIIVMYEGGISGTLLAGEATAENLGLLMMGNGGQKND